MQGRIGRFQGALFSPLGISCHRRRGRRSRPAGSAARRPAVGQGQGCLCRSPRIFSHCDAPLAFAWGFNNSGDKGEYRGKLLRTEDGSFASRIVELLAFKKVRLESVAGLREGLRFEILDYKPGDRISIPNSGSSNAWRARG